MRCRKCRAYIYEGMETCPECGDTHPFTRTFFDYIARVEEILLASALSAMVILVLIQIILRNFFSFGIMGGAEIVRHLVLWVAFLGAGLAAREGKHIKIELARHILPVRTRRIFAVITCTFSVIVCSVLVYASINFVYMDYQGGSVIAFFNIPVWILQVIIPIGFAVVALRFTARCMDNIHALVKGR
ncbi:MAG TPA: TRAP transporter small permease subunit [Deltaproteobacteria bacterium]|nr:TRAP transporter small permease subunit [Deltaproteobacteria bacterium]